MRVDRRRYPRLHLVSDLNGHVIPFQLGVRVLDINADGFAVSSPFEFPAGTTHDFQFAVLRQPRPLVRAVAVHSHRVTPRRGRAFFVSGFAFVNLSDEARHAIDDIVADIDWLSMSKSPVMVPAADVPGLKRDASIKNK